MSHIEPVGAVQSDDGDRIVIYLDAKLVHNGPEPDVAADPVGRDVVIVVETEGAISARTRPGSWEAAAGVKPAYVQLRRGQALRLQQLLGSVVERPSDR
jgi:hypothetical protein